MRLAGGGAGDTRAPRGERSAKRPLGGGVSMRQREVSPSHTSSARGNPVNVLNTQENSQTPKIRNFHLLIFCCVD